jgi:hypothetical protein
MTPEQTIDAVISNRPQPGWAVFNYNFKYAISRIAGRLFFPILFIPAIYIFLVNLEANRETFLILAAFMGSFSLASVLSLIPVVMELINSKSNFIVFSYDGVVKSFKGKTEYFPYDCIKKLRFTNPYGAGTPGIARNKYQYIDFTDARSNKLVSLAKNRIFGPPENVYNLLLTKLPAEQTGTSSQTYSNYSNFFNH